MIKKAYFNLITVKHSFLSLIGLVLTVKRYIGQYSKGLNGVLLSAWGQNEFKPFMTLTTAVSTLHFLFALKRKK